MGKNKKDKNIIKSNWILDFLFEESIPDSEKMFVLALSFAIFSCASMAFVGLYTTPGDWVSFFVLLGISGYYLAITVFGTKTKKIKIGAYITVISSVFVLFPGLFFLSGGNTGGIIAWNLFGITYIMVLINGRGRIILAVIDIIIITFSYFVAWRNPDIFVYFAERKYAIFDSWFSFVLASVFLAILILYQNVLLRRQRDKAMEQVKEIESLNAAQNSFFSNMSHEIRTPINTIIGLNEMTLREDDASDEAIENAMNIESASKMLLSLINDILDMSKIQSGKMDIVPVQYDTKSLFSDVINMVYVQVKAKGLELKINIDENIPSVLLCDDVRLRQILINILNNAVKYTKEGTVTFNVRCENLPDKKVNTVFSISDTGIGIRKENIPHLFDSFKRVDVDKNRFIEGTGLGLSICKQLSDLLGGTLSVDSVYTKGSTFHFSLEQTIIDSTPIGDVDFVVASKFVKLNKYHQSFEAPSARVLVVDDNEMNRTVATKLLRDTRVMVDVTDSGEGALEMCQNNFYNIIFMDHMMPGMDGIECTYKIKHQMGGLNTDTPVVALTANVKTDSDEFYRQAGMDGYLSKPISGTMLEAAMIKFLPQDLITYIDLKSDVVQKTYLDSDRVYKKKCAVSTVSSCDLTDDMLVEYEISIIPYTIVTPYGQFLDRMEISGDQLTDYMKHRKTGIKVDAPSVEEFEEYFSNLLNDCDEVIHFVPGNSVTGLANARKAASSFGSIHIVETNHVSGALGLLAMFSAMLIKNGLSSKEVIALSEDYMQSIETHIMFNRVGSKLVDKNLNDLDVKVGQVLLSKPAYNAKGASSGFTRVYFGDYIKCADRYIKKSLRNREDIDKRFLLVVYSEISVEEVDHLMKTIKKYTDFEMVNALKCSAASINYSVEKSFGFFFFDKL